MGNAAWLFGTVFYPERQAVPFIPLEPHFGPKVFSFSRGRKKETYVFFLGCFFEFQKKRG
jgi:hypothetical protein